MTAPAFSRVWERIDVRGEDECWPSSWSQGSHGYTQFSWRDGGKSHTVLVHRVVYEEKFGPILDALTVDHICRNRVCANPQHFILLTNVDNACDNGNARKTHCPRGHAYDGENTYIDRRGHRKCRACRKRWQ